MGNNHQKSVDHGRTRTCNPLIRSQMPYPLGHRASLSENRKCQLVMKLTACREEGWPPSWARRGMGRAACRCAELIWRQKYERCLYCLYCAIPVLILKLTVDVANWIAKLCYHL